MKFILIFGPRAVGKMTVGHELEKITSLKLFHNHQTIELLEFVTRYLERSRGKTTFELKLQIEHQQKRH